MKHIAGLKLSLNVSIEKQNKSKVRNGLKLQPSGPSVQGRQRHSGFLLLCEEQGIQLYRRKGSRPVRLPAEKQKADQGPLLLGRD